MGQAAAPAGPISPHQPPPASVSAPLPQPSTVVRQKDQGWGVRPTPRSFIYWLNNLFHLSENKIIKTIFKRFIYLF